MLALFAALRWSLAQGPEPHRWTAPFLDLLALRRLHPSAWALVALLLAAPAAWWWREERWIFGLQHGFWASVREMGDIQVALDKLAVVYQFTLAAGAPMVLLLHLFSRWQPRRLWLAWLLLPLLFVAAVAAFIVLHSIAHLLAM